MDPSNITLAGSKSKRESVDWLAFIIHLISIVIVLASSTLFLFCLFKLKQEIQLYNSSRVKPKP
jgi:multisubunit Na+/H+ antiporter MnhC subunit